VWFYFAKIKGAKIILHDKSPNFMAAKLKCFTVDLGPRKHRHQLGVRVDGKARERRFLYNGNEYLFSLRSRLSVERLSSMTFIKPCRTTADTIQSAYVR